LILVTGGAGFIGSHLVNQLIEAGEDVRVVESPHAKVEHLPLDRIELVRTDVRDRAAVKEAVQGCRQVYHLAANPNLWTRDRRDFESVNHAGTSNVLEEALEAGAERVLHTSTESILARASPDNGAVEFFRPNDQDVIGPYCLSKLRGEQEAFRLAAAGAPVIVASPTLPIGPGDRNLTPPSRMTLAFCRGRLPAYLDCRFNMVDVRDVATGLRAAMETGKPGPRYLIGGENLRLIDWLRIVGEIVGRKPPTVAVPYHAALLFAYGSEWMADHVTGRMPLTTVTGVKLTRFNMHFNVTPSRDHLGLKPRATEESARDAVAWFSEHGLL
jgi:dihydroflavonol-4-reductase